MTIALGTPFSAPRPDTSGPAMSWVPPTAAPAPQPMPANFVTDGDHPVMAIPFAAYLGDARLTGTGISVAAAHVAIDGPGAPGLSSSRHVATLKFDFEGFGVTLYPEVTVTPGRRAGEITLTFMDPAGPHLPQLRHIINSYIAGDLMNLRGLLAYTGPTSPKAQKAEGKKSKFRIRSVAVSIISLSLMLAAASVIYDKITQSYEPRPVFITRDGQEMRATTEGQIAYLNPAAKAGEVVFSINSNAGDVLNFQLPCDCRVEVMEGIGVGTTVLPVDVILSFFEANVGLRVQTLMSAEGLAKAMDGEKAYLDINDGRTIAVSVVPGSATAAANIAGAMYIPVTLVPEEGALTEADIGKAARLRLSRDLFRGPLPLLDRILGRTS